MESNAAGGVPSSTTNATRGYFPEKAMIQVNFNGDEESVEMTYPTSREGQATWW